MKKNIAILLILPFLVSLLSIVVVKVTFPMIDLDISGIHWDYEDYECFYLEDTEYALKAEGVTVSNRHLVENDQLVWSVENVDDSEEPHAKIVQHKSEFYLKPLSVGDVYITCSNVKGNVTRRLYGVVYVDDVILIQTKVPSSQSNIDPNLYVGTHDVGNNAKVPASLEFTVRTIPNSIMADVALASQSSNIEVDMSSQTVRVKGEGDAHFTLQTDEKTVRTFSFKVVDGVNVYSYDDLLFCTNRSQTGENIVLRTSFESLNNCYDVDENGLYDITHTKADNVVCFGNYDAQNGKYSFNKEVYKFKTTFNTEFIDQWNAFAKNDLNYKEISNTVVAGLHIQKNIYGNGFTINFHNLAYPYETVNRIIDGLEVALPMLNDDNLFRGPLPYYVLGNPNEMPLATIYGQDNIGLYLDGDNIIVNDLNVRNCDPVIGLSLLNTVGTVVEADGNNITIQNSVMSCGRNVLRTFSSQVNVKNCILSYATNFLCDAGSNKSEPVDVDTVQSIITPNSTTVSQNIWDYLQPKAKGDDVLKNFILYGDDSNGLKKAFKSITAALNHTEKPLDFVGETVLEDCLFYKSGISSIGLESTFNGPFMLTGQSPSALSSALKQFGFLPLILQKVGGVSYPTKVIVKGDSKFFDYKTENDLILEGLIGENVFTIASNLGLVTEQISLKDVLAVGKLLTSQAQRDGYALSSDNAYFNVIVTKCGGGANFSTVELQMENFSQQYSRVDFVDEFAVNDDSYTIMAGRVILVVIGGEPFDFYYCSDETLFNSAPMVATLRKNAAQ